MNISKQFVIVEGAIGAGKTSLANRLALQWGGGLVLDRPQDNPFLARFQGHFQHHALATILKFLLDHGQRAQEMLQAGPGQRPVVSDFMFDKNALFAQLDLDAEEYGLYLQLAERLRFACPVPDLVIYLEASPETLLRRIATCLPDDNAPSLPDGYIQRVQAGYSAYFHQYDASPLLIVNIDHMDLAQQEDFDLLLRCVDEMRGARSYFKKSA